MSYQNVWHITPDEPRVIDLVGDDNAIVHVPVIEINSKPIEFSFRAKREGYQTITLQFYNPQQQMYLEELIIKTKVSRADSSEQHSAAFYDLWNINPSVLSSS